MATTSFSEGLPTSQSEKEQLCGWCQKPIGSNNFMALLLLDKDRNVNRGIYVHSHCPDEDGDNAN
jgi:hypothetical protein